MSGAIVQVVQLFRWPNTGKILEAKDAVLIEF